MKNNRKNTIVKNKSKQTIVNSNRQNIRKSNRNNIIEVGLGPKQDNTPGVISLLERHSQRTGTHGSTDGFMGTDHAVAEGTAVTISLHVHISSTEANALVCLKHDTV